jgi:hypothetical protein
MLIKKGRGSMHVVLVLPLDCFICFSCLIKLTLIGLNVKWEFFVILFLMNWCSEYIIDLMGAPGTLIPPEVPSSHLPTAGFDISGFASLTETPEDSTPLMDQGYGILAFSPNNLDVIPQAGTSTSGQGLFVSIKTNEDGVNLVEKNQIERFEHDFGKLSLSGTEKPSSAQKNRVKNVSKYVISAAKNPDFAQKLHAVLLESGASPPPNLFSDMNLGEPKLLEKVHPENGVNLDDRLRCCLDDMLTGREQSLASLTLIHLSLLMLQVKDLCLLIIEQTKNCKQIALLWTWCLLMHLEWLEVLCMRIHFMHFPCSLHWSLANYNLNMPWSVVTTSAFRRTWEGF